MRTTLLPMMALVVFASVASAAPPLRYDWKPAQTFAYRTTIVVELPDKVETYQGVTTYDVKSVEAASRQVTYHGGLGKSTKYKEQEQPRGFGPRFRVPGPPSSPFARNNFRGSETTTNEITISPQGKVNQLKGDSQLPYLLGNVSLLPFETLPDQPQQQWKVETGTSITEKSDHDDRFPRFGHFGPFGTGQREEEVQAASETSAFAITGEAGDIVTLSKAYELKSPSPKAGEQSFSLSGKGTWKFNRKLGVSESLQMDQQLIVNTNNQQVTVPIKIEYQRLTEDELAKVVAERKQQLEEAKRRHEEHVRAKEAEKRLAEAPLTDAEKHTTLAALQATDTAEQIESLTALAKKSPKSPDADIAAAVEGLLKHRERSVREAAHQALLKWSTSYGARAELDNQYAGRHGVTPTGRAVGPTTPLYVGQIVLQKDHSRWIPAEVLEVQSDGQVKTHPRGWNTNAWDKAVTRDQLQLAPEELFQPARSPDAVASAAVALRTWTDKTGTHKIEAAYLGLSEGKVQLKRKDQREIKVALDSLSKEDQAYVADLQKAAAAPPNPFDQ